MVTAFHIIGVVLAALCMSHMIMRAAYRAAVNMDHEALAKYRSEYLNGTCRHLDIDPGKDTLYDTKVLFIPLNPDERPRRALWPTFPDFESDASVPCHLHVRAPLAGPLPLMQQAHPGYRDAPPLLVSEKKHEQVHWIMQKLRISIGAVASVQFVLALIKIGLEHMFPAQKKKGADGTGHRDGGTGGSNGAEFPPGLLNDGSESKDK